MPDVKISKLKLISAFSLVELMVVIAIVALLTAIAVPSYKNYVQQVKLNEIFNLVSVLTRQWELKYNLEPIFNLVVSNDGIGKYISSAQIIAGDPGPTPSNSPQIGLPCYRQVNPNILGVVCLSLNEAAGTDFDQSLNGQVLYFTATETNNSTGITWTCYVEDIDSTDPNGAAAFLQSKNCARP